MKISSVEAKICHVSEKTNWFFLAVGDEHGHVGLGEATLNGWEMPQLSFLDAWRKRLMGQSPQAVFPKLVVYPHGAGGLIASSVISALEQALTDLCARQEGVPVYEWLGGARREAVRVYANINRGARDRNPEGIAKAALHAVGQGFGAVKIAPFDGVFWADADKPGFKALVQKGIERVAAIREAVGPDIDVMVDCHWRFNEHQSLALLEQLKPLKLFWIECPVSENPHGFDALERVHEATNRMQLRLSGAELQIGERGFAPFIESHRLDVVMPDIKYAGGYAQMLRIAELCERQSVHFSPHNPSGPICNLASLHLCARAKAFLILEHQLAESPLYEAVVGGYKPRLMNGCFQLPQGPGLGAGLDQRVLDQHPYEALADNANLDPRLG
jgi:galactonate dehydratase